MFYSGWMSSSLVGGWGLGVREWIATSIWCANLVNAGVEQMFIRIFLLQTLIWFVACEMIPFVTPVSTLANWRGVSEIWRGSVQNRFGGINVMECELEWVMMDHWLVEFQLHEKCDSYYSKIHFVSCSSILCPIEEWQFCISHSGWLFLCE